MRVAIRGRVQGVFYRAWTVENARELGIAGWVRNCGDGAVAAHLQGEPEVVSLMVRKMYLGPPAARVDRIEEFTADVEELVGFQQR